MLKKIYKWLFNKKLEDECLKLTKETFRKNEIYLQEAKKISTLFRKELFKIIKSYKFTHYDCKKIINIPKNLNNIYDPLDIVGQLDLALYYKGILTECEIKIRFEDIKVLPYFYNRCISRQYKLNKKKIAHIKKEIDKLMIEIKDILEINKEKNYYIIDFNEKSKKFKIKGEKND